MKNIIRTLRVLRHISPKPSKKDAFRNVLVSRMRLDSPAPLRWTFLFAAFRPAAFAMLCSALIILGGGGATFAAQGALPGELLYPVKIATEQMQVALTPDTVQKTALELKFAGKRLDEVDQLITEQKAAPKAAETALTAYDQTLAKTQATLSSDQTKSVQIASLIDQATASNEKTIQALAEKATKDPRHQNLVKHLEDTGNQTEMNGDAALLSIVSSTSTNPLVIPADIAQRSRARVQTKQKHVEDAAQIVQQVQQDTGLATSTAAADIKLKEAEDSITQANDKLSHGDFRASLENSIRAQKAAQEAQTLAQQHQQDSQQHQNNKQQGNFSHNRGDD